jgi:hypothetical protein
LLEREGIEVHAVEQIAPTLEDVFISAVKSSSKERISDEQSH